MPNCGGYLNFESYPRGGLGGDADVVEPGLDMFGPVSAFAGATDGEGSVSAEIDEPKCWFGADGVISIGDGLGEGGGGGAVVAGGSDEDGGSVFVDGVIGDGMIVGPGAEEADEVGAVAFAVNGVGGLGVGGGGAGGEIETKVSMRRRNRRCRCEWGRYSMRRRYGG